MGLFPRIRFSVWLLSLCPAVAVTTSIKNGLLLGIAVVFVQVLSSCTVSIFKSFIHPRIRIPAYVIIIALWVSVIDMILPVIIAGCVQASRTFHRIHRGLCDHHFQA